MLRRRSSLVVLMVAVAVVASAFPAQAHVDVYGYRTCDQQLSLSGSTLRIGTDSNAPFPPSVIRDGVTNSFTDRIVDATGRWSASVDPWTNYGLAFVGVNSPEIPIKYVELSKAYSGIATQNAGSVDCQVIHGGSAQPSSAYIRIDVGDLWFTQDDSRRAYWESCATDNDGSYTCSKPYDFGTVVTHELGHIMGLGHPESVDNHIGSSSASQTANCVSTVDDATMCAEYTKYRSTWRTLHSWDVESLKRQYTY